MVNYKKPMLLKLLLAASQNCHHKTQLKIGVLERPLNAKPKYSKYFPDLAQVTGLEWLASLRDSID